MRALTARYPITRSASDDGHIPGHSTRSEIVDTVNNLKIVTMYSFAEIEGCQSRLYRISTAVAVFPDRMTLDLREFDSESKEKNGFFKNQICVKDII